jgi:SAM-dependent methyltransferase
MSDETGAGSGQVLVTEEAMKPHSVHGVQRSASRQHNVDVSPASTANGGDSAEGPGLWSAFWQEFCLENMPHERCHIPGDGRYVVDQHWAHFANILPRGAQVIDLGCGAGIVGRTLLGRRSDLRVTGVDFANVPTPVVENLTILPGVRMEALPFEDRRFDAAISLFGIEYGNIDQTAGELGRVLKSGAHFSFLVHHLDSEIVGEGIYRRKALQQLLSAKVRAVFLSGDMASVELQIARLREQFPGEPSIKLFTDYLRHHATLPRAERQAKWQNLLDGLGPEIALLERLEDSAKSAAGVGSWLASLLPVMRVVSVALLPRSSGEPIAWQVNGIR